MDVFFYPYIFLMVLFWIFFLMRWSRWLAIVQQKEYRIDRLLSFLRSAEGRNEVFHVLPAPQEFTRKGLKRPVRTKRVLIVAVLSVLILGLFYFLGSSWQYAALMEIALYFALPFVTLVACLPTAIVAQLVTQQTLKKAQQKILAVNPKIIGVGGSYGKTSTKHLLAHVLSQKYSVFVTPKSHNTKYSVAQSICQSFSNQQIALLEYGAYTKGEISYLTQWFLPEIAIETGFTLQHLGLFGSEKNSLEAESELISALPDGGHVFCNGADAGAAEICKIGIQNNFHKIQVHAYSGLDSQINLQNTQLNEKGELSFVWSGKKVSTHLVGLHYVVNIQAVIAVAKFLDVSEEQIITALESFTPNASFVRTSQLPSGAVVIDDGGTSNPKGFEAAINLAKEMKQTRKILISAGIVDLGNQSQVVHADLAEKAHAVFETILYVGTDGYREFKEKFGEKMITDQREILELLGQLSSEDMIVIEGRIPKWLEKKMYA